MFWTTHCCFFMAGKCQENRPNVKKIAHPNFKKNIFTQTCLLLFAHTCSEQSLRILMWNASNVQKPLQLKGCGMFWGCFFLVLFFLGRGHGFLPFSLFSMTYPWFFIGFPSFFRIFSSFSSIFLLFFIIFLTFSSFSITFLSFLNKKTGRGYGGEG